MLGPTRSRLPGRWLGVGLSVLLVAGCMVTQEPSPSPSAGNVAASASPAGAATPRPSAPSASAPAAPVAGPLAGIWRVRKVLSLDDRSALIPGTVFDEEAYVVSPGCSNEPCPTLEVRMTPLGRTEPVSVAALKRDGDVYVSAAQAENEGPCLDIDGDRVQGGATVTSTLRLWLASVRPVGTAVESTALMGSLELALAPTEIGTAAGCAPETATYELSGRREAVAVRGDPPPEPDRPPNTAGGMANLPSISVKVAGAKISYFPVGGDTVRELVGSLANSGIKACGAINYEWHEGDDRPAACAITAFPGFEAAIEQRFDAGSGECTVTKSNVKARFTIHMPRWTSPKRVPARLLDWWRKVVVFIRDHEAGHVRISLAYVKKLNTRLRGAECDSAGSIIGKWAKQLNSAQEEYDRAEYSKPWPLPPFGY